MSSPKIGLDLDYVVAVDPGYATQGICVLGRAGEIHEFFSSVTTSSLGIHARILWQLLQIKHVLANYGSNGLLVVEEFHAGGTSKASPTSVYNRGWYDGLFREQISRQIKYAITVHNSAVWAFSEQQRIYKTVAGKKKWQKPTVDQIMAYTMRLWPWLESKANPLDNWYRLENRQRTGARLDSIEPKEKSKMHAVDALVMACMGFAAYQATDCIFRCTPKQREWIMQIHETYPYKCQEPETGFR